MLLFLEFAVLLLGAAAARHLDLKYAPLVVEDTLMRSPPTASSRSHSIEAGDPLSLKRGDGKGVKSLENGDLPVILAEAKHKRVPRGSKDDKSRQKDQRFPHNYRHPRPYDPDGYFTTPKITKLSNGSFWWNSRNGSNWNKASVRIHNPLYPVTDNTYSAYAVMLLSLIVFAVGIVGNLAVMCIVWHNYYLKTTWNYILASLAFWDFVVLFFCLPVVIFNELTKRRLLGDISCRIVPYIEVTSLGVTTFSLCALSIDRFHAVTSAQPKVRMVEPCQSILAKLAVVWVGSMVLAAPELPLWQLQQGVSPDTGLPVDSCIRLPSPTLPESLYSLVVTYHEARMWWCFGCFLCLPLLFTLACQLLTRHVVEESAPGAAGRKKGGRPSSSSTSTSSSSTTSSSSSPKKRQRQERRLSRTVGALAAVYGGCTLPGHACDIGLAYAAVEVSGATLELLALIQQFLLFVRAAATPLLLLCLCRSLGQAFMDCCCCCCDECLPDGGSSSSSSSCTTATTAMSSSCSPSSVSSPSSTKEERLKIVSGSLPAVVVDKAKDSDAVALAIGTPC